MDELIEVDTRSCVLVEQLERSLLVDFDLGTLAVWSIDAGVKRFYREPEVLPNDEAVVTFVSYPGVRNKAGQVLNTRAAKEANRWLEQWLDRRVRARMAARETK